MNGITLSQTDNCHPQRMANFHCPRLKAVLSYAYKLSLRIRRASRVNNFRMDTFWSF